MAYPFEIVINDAYETIKDELCGTKAYNVFGLLSLNDFEDNKWRYSKFQKYIWDNLKETALSKKERDVLAGEPASALSKSAKNLRITNNDIAGGEIAEIFLYGIMKDHYGALPIVPKIFYKQNPNDYAKGADSVHIVIDYKNNSFSLWLGEAKFYSDIENDRLDAIVNSVFQTLATDKIRKENSIILNVGDLDSFDEIGEDMKANIKELLSGETSIDKLKPHLHVPIMILYESARTKRETSYNLEYVEEMKAYYKDKLTAYVQKQILKCMNSVANYESITFHVLLFPVPDKDNIVTHFKETANALRSI